MSEHAYLIFPLACALFYALAAMLLKQAIHFGVGAWRMTVVNSWVMAAVFSVMLLLPGVPWRELVWYQPLCSGLLSLVGNLFAVLALSRGDVSVATPIMGTKVILVALLTMLILDQAV